MQDNPASSTPILPFQLPHFNNPVCKQTYESLPRIYGSRKLHKHKYLHIQSKINTNIAEYENKYSHVDRLAKKNARGYMIPQSSTGRKTNEDSAEGTPSFYRRVGLNLLNQVRSFQLSDLETNHKVNPIINNGINQMGRTSSSQMQSILVNSRRLLKLRTQPSEPHKSLDPLPKKELPKKFQKIDEQPQQQTGQVNISHSARPQLHQSHRQKTTIQTAHSFSQRSAVSFSRIALHDRNQSTMFGSLEKKEKTGNGRYSRINSVLESGLFRVPTEKQYRKYIQGYKSIGENFNFLELVKKKNFKIIRDQKSVYFGETNSLDEKHGLGVNVSQREIFQGEYANGLKIVGFERNIDGIYIGGYKNGLRSGEGSFKWNNGEVFQGLWQNGMKNGFGKWKSPQGHYYEGDWQHNRQHGEGIFKHNISTYKGEFKNFLKHGHGEQIFANSDKYVGQYKQGKPQGRGRYDWHTGGHYQGQFKLGKRDGYGLWYDSDGTKYEGQFKEDSKHGKGRQVYKSGERFQGIFRQGTRIKGRLINNQNQQVELISK